jgi:putative flippase GtrA
MAAVDLVKREGVLCGKHVAVSLAGFAIDAALLHLIMAWGLEPAWARVVSLVLAMQATFAVNRRHVFGHTGRWSLHRQWWSYMLSNGFGNFCNYWIFVTLVSLHWRPISTPLLAMTAGALIAWMINYAAARFWVFAHDRRSRRISCAPADGAHSGP